MSLKDQQTLRIVLYEGENGQVLDAPQRLATMAALLEKGYAVTRLSGEGKVAPADRNSLLVLGRFAEQGPQPEASNGHEDLRLNDITNLDVPQICALVEEARARDNAARHGEWKPWFPVIDYGRCTNCMQCLSFCLFDVYGVSKENQIQVQHQNNCKTDCPACSRVCPEVAILFPKYKSGPINGDEIDPEDLRREAMKVDISALLGGDIYQALRDRSAKAKSRVSKERDQDKALKERMRCLQKLSDSMEVPAEALAALPPADQIAAKAAAAKTKAEAALNASQS